jgi:uncharacterized protein YlxW (UPF0749 family)
VFDLTAVECGPASFCIAEAEGSVSSLEDAGENSSIVQLNNLCGVIRVDGEAGLADIAGDGVVVAVDEISKVWADSGVLSVEGVAA